MTDEEENKVVSINYFKEKEAQEIVDFIRDTDEVKAIEYLARVYVECHEEGKNKLADQLVEAGIKLRADNLRVLVEKRINQLRDNNETSSD